MAKGSKTTAATATSTATPAPSATPTASASATSSNVAPISIQQNPLNIIEFRTNKATILKNLFESIRYVLSEANIIFTEDSIKITAMNSAKNVVVFCKLNGNDFEHYYCKNRVTVGIDVGKIAKTLKAANNNNIISFFIESTWPNKLWLTTEDDVYQESAKYCFDLLSLDEEEVRLPEFIYPVQISLPSSRFQKRCRELETSNVETVQLISSNGSLAMSAYQGGIASMQEFIFQAKSAPSVEEGDVTPICRGVYNLKYISYFTKTTALSDEIRLYLKNDFYLMIEYPIQNYGYLRFMIEPVNTNVTAAAATAAATATAASVKTMAP